jgi:hypothetical protein
MTAIFFQRRQLLIECRLGCDLELGLRPSNSGGAATAILDVINFSTRWTCGGRGLYSKVAQPDPGQACRAIAIDEIRLFVANMRGQSLLQTAFPPDS